MKNPLARYATVAVTALGLAFAFAGCGDDSTTEPHVPYSTIETWMGTGLAGLGAEGSTPLETHLYLPQDMTWGPDGRPYIVDWNNHRILVVQNGVIHRLIGTGELGDGKPGLARDTQINHPTHINFDPQGMLIMSAWHNSKVMIMNLATGMIDNYCGTGARSFGGDGGPALQSALNLPTCTAFDDQGRLLIIDQANQRVRRVDEHGNITSVVGTGLSAFGGDGGPAGSAYMRQPVGQAAFPSGRMEWNRGKLYFCDTNNNRIRMVDEDWVIHTVAGGGPSGDTPQENVPATEARLTRPCDLAFDSAGNLFIADTFAHAVRRVDAATGMITTFAGQITQFGDTEGVHPSQALLNRPYGVAFDANDNLYIADTHNHKIKVVRK